MNTRLKLTNKPTVYLDDATLEQEDVDFTIFKREVEKMTNGRVEVIKMEDGNRFDVLTRSPQNGTQKIELKMRDKDMHCYDEWFINAGKYNALKDVGGYFAFIFNDGWCWYRAGAEENEFEKKWIKVKNRTQGECLELNYLIPDSVLNYYPFSA